MKIHPARPRLEPKYPTQGEAEWNPALLAHVPARWEKSSGFAALLGLLAFSGSSRSDATEEKAPMERPDRRPAPAMENEKTAHQVRRATAVVAPILDEALAYDGRGTFGCEASEPARFLAEDDALELIREELEAAGLNLKFAVDLDQVMAPTGEFNRKGWKEPKTSWDEGDDMDDYDPYALRGPPAKTAPGKYTFDWADPERSIYIEYLSQRDHRNWEQGYNSTAWSMNFSDVAQQVAKAFSRSPLDQPAIFGVFFDPLAHKGAEQVNISDLAPEQLRLAGYERRKRADSEGEKRGREKLRRQVRHFVDFLKQEGIVPPAK
jgi:hypothetical protein